MRVFIPLGVDGDDKPNGFANNEGFDGGFHPVGENNLWHGGVHLKTTDPIFPVADGEVIALRITEDYVADPAKKELSKEKVESSGGKMAIYEKYYEKSSNDADYHYQLKSDFASDDEARVAISKELGQEYSNNFVLMKHKFTTPEELEINFYSLYMHLLPWKKHTKDHKLPFYRRWKYFVDSDQDGSGKVVKDENGSEIGVALLGSYVEVCQPNNITTALIESTRDNNYNYLSVKVEAMNGKKGFIQFDEEDMKKVSRKQYKVTANADFFRQNKKDMKGTLWAGVKDEFVVLPGTDTPAGHWTKSDNKTYVKIKVRNNLAKSLEEVGYVKKSQLQKVYNGNTWWTLKEDAVFYEKPHTAELRRIPVNNFNIKGYLDKDDLIKLIDANEQEGYVKVKCFFFGWQNRDDDKVNNGYQIGYVEADKVELVRNDVYKIVGNKVGKVVRKEGLAVCSAGIDGNDKVIGIIAKGDEISFSDEDSFISQSCRGRHQLSSKVDPYGGNFINVGEGFIKVEKNFISSEIEPDKVVVPSTPLPISIKERLCYAGKIEGEASVYHLETFTDDVGFMDNPNSDGKDLYVLNVGATGFKKLKEPDVVTEVKRGSYLRLADNNYEGGGRDVELVAGPEEPLWIKWADLPTWNEAKKRYIATEDMSVKAYTSHIKKGGGHDGEEVDVVIYKKEEVRWLDSSDEAGYAATYEPGYRKVGLHRKVEAKRGFTLRSKIGDNSAWNSTLGAGGLYTTQNDKMPLYKTNPEIKEFGDNLKKGSNNEENFTVMEELKYKDEPERVFEGNSTVEWLGFKLEGGDSPVGWVKKSGLSNHKIDTVNLYKWTDYFEKSEGREDEKVIDLKEIIKKIEGESGDSRLAEGEVYNAIKSSLETAKYLRTLAVKHPTEWSINTYDDKMKQALAESDEVIDGDEFDELKSNLEANLTFWEAVQGLPDFKSLWFFNPIAFINHFRKILGIDVRALLESMTVQNINGVNRHAVSIFGKKILMHIGFSARDRALIALDKHENAESGTTLAENMEITLQKTIKMMNDPELANVENLRINSTYRPNSSYGHRNCLSVDLGGAPFNFTMASFDRELSLKFANKLGEYGATRILFNCPYVIDKAEGIKVCSWIDHHHHFHVDFIAERADLTNSNTLCYGRDSDGNGYICSKYPDPESPDPANHCDYAGRRSR